MRDPHKIGAIFPPLADVDAGTACLRIGCTVGSERRFGISTIPILRRFSALAIALAALASAPQSSALADTHYATPNPAGGADCSQANPCALSTAVHGAFTGDGDEVVVGPGTYDLTGGGFLFIDDAIDLHGASGGPRPRIRADGPESGIIVTDAATLRDLELHYGGDNYALRLRPSTGVAVGERLVVKASSSACLLGSAEIRDSICQANHNATGADGLSVVGGIASDDFEAIATNVTAIGASTLGGGEHGIEVFAGEGSSQLLQGMNVIAIGGDSDVHVATLGSAASSASAMLVHSNFSGASTNNGPGTEIAPVAGANDNQTAEPLLADPFPIPDAFASDLHQLPGSPTIDAGISGIGVGGFDIDGEPRCMGGEVDIGADERTATACGAAAPAPSGAPPSQAVSSRSCRGKAATIVAEAGRLTGGTRRRDVIVGTPRRDRIRARGGNDLVCAGGGNDVVLGGAGRDTLVGQGGRDTLRGGSGPDLLVGGPGLDKLIGGPAGDRLVGRADIRNQ